MGKTNRWLNTLDTAIDDGYGDDMPELDAQAAFDRIIAAEEW